MADRRIGWKFCPYCGVPWPMNRPERIRDRLMICGNCEGRIPDIDGWMDDCRMYMEKAERLTAWLVLIDGGDRPLSSAILLRLFAFKALRGEEVNDE